MAISTAHIMANLVPIVAALTLSKYFPLNMLLSSLLSNRNVCLKISLGISLNHKRILRRCKLVP